MTVKTRTEDRAHADLVALLDARRDSASVRELLRVQRLVDDGVLTAATAVHEVDVTYDEAEFPSADHLRRAVEAGARALATGLPVDVTLVTMDGPAHWPLVRLEGAPGDVAVALARYGLKD